MERTHTQHTILHTYIRILHPTIFTHIYTGRHYDAMTTTTSSITKALPAPPPPPSSPPSFTPQLLQALNVPHSLLLPLSSSLPRSLMNTPATDTNILRRLQFLWQQALHHLPTNPTLSRTFSRELVRVRDTALAQASLHPRLEELLCGGCGLLLVPGLTAHARVHHRGTHGPSNNTRRRRRQEGKHKHHHRHEQQQQSPTTTPRPLLKNELTYTCKLCQHVQKADGVVRRSLDQEQQWQQQSSAPVAEKTTTSTSFRRQQANRTYHDSNSRREADRQIMAATGAKGVLATAEAAEKAKEEGEEEEEDFIPLGGGGGYRGNQHHQMQQGGGGPPHPRLLLDSKPRNRKRKGGGSGGAAGGRGKAGDAVGDKKAKSSSLGNLRGFLSSLKK